MKLGIWRSSAFAVVIMASVFLPSPIRGQMAYYYDAAAAECQQSYGSSRDCGYGTRGQNWFGTYYLGKSNPYNFVSTMPFGYGSGAMPLFQDPYSGGWLGTSYGPGGYMASALPPNSNLYSPTTMQNYQQPAPQQQYPQTMAYPNNNNLGYW